MSPHLMNDSANRRIMVVDDSATVRVMVTGMLREFGSDFLTASDGAEAWALLERQAVDLVVTDYSMARVDGLELVRRIRASAFLSKTRTVLLTATAQDVRDEAMRSGVDAVLTKPVHVQELRQLVRQMLDGTPGAAIETPPRQPTATYKAPARQGRELLSVQEPWPGFVWVTYFDALGLAGDQQTVLTARIDAVAPGVRRGLLIHVDAPLPSIPSNFSAFWLAQTRQLAISALAMVGESKMAHIAAASLERAITLKKERCVVKAFYNLDEAQSWLTAQLGALG